MLHASETRASQLSYLNKKLEDKKTAGPTMLTHKPYSVVGGGEYVFVHFIHMIRLICYPVCFIAEGASTEITDKQISKCVTRARLSFHMENENNVFSTSC